MKTEVLAHRIRSHAVDMTHLGKSSHVASVLSIADILALLYGKVLQIDPQNPCCDERDRFILSKGHAGAGVYAALAEVGFFSRDRLKTHYQNGSNLSGHVSHKNNPGVEFSTGSLGHGLSVGAGIALNGKLMKKCYKTFVLMSDGECDEGSNWEAILFAGHKRLDHLTAVVDYNKLQSLTSTTDTLDLEPFADKWRAFGWHVREVDGHDHDELGKAFQQPHEPGKPKCIIAHTLKGKGVSFMENSVLWHYRSPQGAEYLAAKRELEEAMPL